MTNKSRVTIATVPWTDTKSPIMAPAVLKSALINQGISAHTVDLNAEIRHWLTQQSDSNDILRFMLTEQITASSRSSIKNMIDIMANRLISIDSEWIALSLLTYLSQIPTKWLCLRLRQLRPDTHIVIGGPGAFTSLKSGDQFAKNLARQGLIDHYVSGDAEISLPKLILGHQDWDGVDSTDWKQIDDLDALPWPNFDDYRWELYDSKKISIVGSRGCVRKCTFCDIHEHWTRYQWRSADSIFEEMSYQRRQHGIRLFSFSDSLVNGNQKEFRKLITKLSEHNQTLPDDQRIRWTGSFIIRPQDQMKEKDWALTAQSGAVMLSLGVESFVEKIRYHIGKKFSNDDLEFALKMAKKYHVKVILLMIVGYVTETQEDFDESLQWIRSHSYFADDPVMAVQLGSGLGILPNTWLDRHKESIGVQLQNQNVLQDWIGTKNPSTPQMRMGWHKQMNQCLTDNGFAAEFTKDNHVLIESYLNEKYS